MKILLTGASGFVGSYVAKELAKTNKVTLLSRSKIHIPDTHLVVFENFTDSIVDSAAKGIDAIVHIAGQIHGRWPEMYASNVTFTEHLVRIAQNNNVGYFIYISSENVTRGNPDIYTRTKFLAEKAVEKFNKHLILRPVVIYGPRDERYVGRLVEIMRRFPVIPILGKGNNIFQFVFIGDLVRIIDNALAKKTTGIYTIAGGTSISYKKFIYILKRELNIPKPVWHIPLWVLKPISHILNIVLKNPPLTPSQIQNLSKDHRYDLNEQEQVFSIKTTPLITGLQKAIKEK